MRWRNGLALLAVVVWLFKSAPILEPSGAAGPKVVHGPFPTSTECSITWSKWKQEHATDMLSRCYSQDTKDNPNGVEKD